MKRNLQKGMTGPEIRELQNRLNTQGYRLPPTGYFGRQTDEAVRGFQSRKGLVPDGIVGYRTKRALGLERGPVHPSGGSSQPDGSSSHPAGHPSHPVGPNIDPLGAASGFLRNLSDLARRIGCDVAVLLESARKARARERNAPKPAPSQAPTQAPAPAGKPSPAPKQAPAEAPGDDRLQDVKGMRISKKGLRFIFTHESQKGVSNRLHWPKGKSGVTLGSGYDMRYRGKPEIIKDMTSIGLDPLTAKKVAEGSELSGADAYSFAKNNRELVNLTEQQEMQLLILKVPEYEDIVKSNIRVKLYQYQYDALVCFAYNVGPKPVTAYRQINKGNVVDAMATINKYVKSGKNVVKHLQERRKHEIALYLHRDYGRLRG